VADRPDSEQAALASYGRNLGIAFQLVDDALDYSGRQATLGKTVGDDFREGKLTLPVVLAYRRGTADERAFWERTLRDGDQQDGDMENAISIMERHGCLDDTIGRARHYGAIACDALAIFPESDMRDVLISLVHFCVNRSY
jgi:octaprenyl-diphosphate synthase